MEIMTIEEFMLKPIIDKALDDFNLDQLNFIKYSNMFSAAESIDVNNIKIIPLEEDRETFSESQLKGSIGQFCKLYKRCMCCNREVFYHKFVYCGNWYNWRKNKICLECKTVSK